MRSIAPQKSVTTAVMIAVWCLGCTPADDPPPATQHPDETSTPVECESVVNVIERIECYASLATDTNDPSVCGQSPDEAVRYQCYAIVAKRLANVELCDMIPTHTTDHQQLKDACISDIAKKTLEPLLCDRVETVGLRDSCYAAIGQKTANRALCDKIQDPGLRSFCSGDPVMVDTTEREPSGLALGLGQEVAGALEAFNPQFRARTTQDYSPTVQDNAADNDRQPFMLRLDANQDGAADIVLDGHDDQHNILLCLLSSPDGYDVVVIRESSLLVPDAVESWNDGVKENGLNYYLWPLQEGAGFTLAFPQQSDAEGNLLNDGFMIDYSFSDGAFTEKAQVL